MYVIAIVGAGGKTSRIKNLTREYVQQGKSVLVTTTTHMGLEPDMVLFENLEDIRKLPHVFDMHYEDQLLTVRCTGARHNLIRLLNYLQSQDLTFGRVFSELPTLNDVFLEITGKQLRD